MPSMSSTPMTCSANRSSDDAFVYSTRLRTSIQPRIFTRHLVHIHTRYCHGTYSVLLPNPRHTQFFNTLCFPACIETQHLLLFH